MDSRAVAAYLSGLLVFCKSLGPAIYAIVFAPIILSSRPRLWVKLGCITSLIVCAYPLLRENGLAPTEIVSNIATKISPERNASFAVRLLNEGQLLAKAENKPWFGWGGYGRNRIFDSWTGEDISVTDGAWIIFFGVYGWFGFLSFFGLLAAALFEAHRATDRDVNPSSVTRGGLALILTVCLINCLPNSVEQWLLFLLAGSIAATPAGARRVASRSPAEVVEQAEPVVDDKVRAYRFGRKIRAA